MTLKKLKDIILEIVDQDDSLFEIILKVIIVTIVGSFLVLKTMFEDWKGRKLAIAFCLFTAIVIMLIANHPQSGDCIQIGNNSYLLYNGNNTWTNLVSESQSSEEFEDLQLLDFVKVKGQKKYLVFIKDQEGDTKWYTWSDAQYFLFRSKEEEKRQSTEEENKEEENKDG